MLIAAPIRVASTQLQLLLDGQPQEMSFRELKDNAAQRASLPAVHGFTLPADVAVLAAGKTADHL